MEKKFFSIGDTVLNKELSQKTFIVEVDTRNNSQVYVGIPCERLALVRNYIRDDEGDIIDRDVTSYVSPNDLVPTRMLLLEKEYEWSRELNFEPIAGGLTNVWVNGVEVF